MAADVDALASFPGSKVQNGYRIIKCPFHNDSNPSCSVKLKPPYQGCFKCFSCGEKGGFTKLAKQLGIDTNAKATPDLYPEEYKDLFEYTGVGSGKEMEEDESFVKKTYPLTDANAQRLGILDDGWRTFDIPFMRDVVQARVINNWSLYFPVLVNGVEEGYVRAMVNKPKDKKMPSYLNKKGTWSKTKGMLYFDQAMAIASQRKTKTVILCEGPRDSARLIRDANLPAITILGTQSWSLAKARLLSFAGVENVILCFDGDDAGEKASLDISEAIEGYFNVTDFALYEWEGRYDPFNMPQKLLNKLVKLYDRISA